MHWITIVLAGHFLNALAFLMDKFLLTKKIPSPFVYAFFIGVLGILALVLIPFGFTVPSGAAIVRAAVAGATFILALIFFFAGLKENEASRVVPLTGGLVPFFTFVFAYVFLSERLGHAEIVAFIFLLAGSVLISIDRSPSPNHSSRRRGQADNPLLSKEGAGGGFGLGYLYAVIAALIFAISFVITKQVFLEQSFISGFIWSRLGGFIFALLILFIPAARRAIIRQRQKKQAGKTAALFFIGQASGAFGFLLVNYAISLASVSLVNAMQGVQYAFLLVMVILLSKKFPRILSEKLRGTALAQKIFAIALISLGIGLITL